MKEKYLSITYFALGLLACFFTYKENLYVTIAFRTFGLVLLGVIYSKYGKSLKSLCYTNLFFASIGTAIIILGFQDYQRAMFIVAALYYWTTFFLIKKDVNEPGYSVRYEYMIPSVIVLMLFSYLVVEVFTTVMYEILDNIMYAYITTISYLVVIVYMGFIYLSKQSFRNILLLPVICTYTIAFVLVPLEAFYYPSLIFKQVVSVTEICSHFFLIKFLITSEGDFGTAKDVSVL